MAARGRARCPRPAGHGRLRRAAGWGSCARRRRRLRLVAGRRPGAGRAGRQLVRRRRADPPCRRGRRPAGDRGRRRDGVDGWRRRAARRARPAAGRGRAGGRARRRQPVAWAGGLGRRVRAAEGGLAGRGRAARAPARPAWPADGLTAGRRRRRWHRRHAHGAGGNGGARSGTGDRGGRPAPPARRRRAVHHRGGADRRAERFAGSWSAPSPTCAPGWASRWPPSAGRWPSPGWRLRRSCSSRATSSVPVPSWRSVECLATAERQRVVETMAVTSGASVEQLLGDEAESLLGYEAGGISRGQLIAPGPDFIDRVVLQTDRNPQVLRSLARCTGTAGWPAPATSRSCPSTRASSTRPARRSPRTPLLRPGEHRQAGDRGRLQRRRLHLRRARDRSPQVRPQDPVHRQDQPQRAADLPEPVRPGHVRHGPAGLRHGRRGGRRDDLLRRRTKRRARSRRSRRPSQEAHELGMATVLWCYLRNTAFKKDGATTTSPPT